MSRSCKECVHHNPDFIDNVCLHCSWPEFAGEPSNFKPKPITNADRIRGMSDEGLAEWLGLKVSACNENEKCGNDYTCDACWLEWLKQEGET